MTRHCRIIEHGKFQIVALPINENAAPYEAAFFILVAHYSHCAHILISRKHTLKG